MFNEVEVREAFSFETHDPTVCGEGRVVMGGGETPCFAAPGPGGFCFIRKTTCYLLVAMHLVTCYYIEASSS